MLGLEIKNQDGDQKRILEFRHRMIADKNQSFLIPGDRTAYVDAELAKEFKKPKIQSEKGSYKPDNESMTRVVKVLGQLIYGPSRHNQTNHQDREKQHKYRQQKYPDVHFYHLLSRILYLNSQIWLVI